MNLSRKTLAMLSCLSCVLGSACAEDTVRDATKDFIVEVEPISEETKEKLSREVDFGWDDANQYGCVCELGRRAGLVVVVDPAMIEYPEPKMKLKVHRKPVLETLRNCLEKWDKKVKVWHIDDGLWISIHAPEMNLRIKPSEIPSLDPVTESKLTRCFRALSSDDFDVRQNAEQTIKTIGPGAIPALKSLLENEVERNWEVHSRVTRLVNEFKEILSWGNMEAEAVKTLKRKVKFEFVGYTKEEVSEYLRPFLHDDVKLEFDSVQEVQGIGTARLDIAAYIRWLARVNKVQLVYKPTSIRLVGNANVKEPQTEE